jgi:hypothetical protein
MAAKRALLIKDMTASAITRCILAISLDKAAMERSSKQGKMVVTNSWHAR